MSPEQKRDFIIEAYPGPSWKAKVMKMTDAQVHTIYMRLINRKKI